ncbi:MAG: RNA polymerase sigma factor [Armatimonadetes bacterium]|nr:RNA polymerase sigma factor [Armatimonadota bacterium]
MTNDPELVQRAAAGDCEAFTALVERYRDAVRGVAWHHLGDPDDAQDAAQETFVRAWLGIKGLREPERFGPWLRRIAANACADLLRRRGAAALSLDAMPERDLPAAEPAPDEDVERLAARLVVREALGRLSAPTRLTVTLALINGYSHEEIAGFLEVPVDTVRSRLKNARKRLREEMVGMVSDVLSEGKPDPDFARRVVEEALRRGAEAQYAFRRDEAKQHFDAALVAAEKLAPDLETRRLEMQALQGKARAIGNRAWQEGVSLLERALAIAEELGDREQQGYALHNLARQYTFGESIAGGQRDRIVEFHRKARAAFDEVGDPQMAGGELFSLASQQIRWGEGAAARHSLEEALSQSAAATSPSGPTKARAALAMIAAVGEERVGDIIDFQAGGFFVRVEDGKGFASGGAGMTGGRDHGPPEASELARHLDAVLWQISLLCKELAHPFLDASVPVGGGWSGEVILYPRTLEPLRGTITVVSDSERVDVPAGAFEGCLLTELVITEGGGPAGGARNRRWEVSRRMHSGTRRAWYAPGVGLVRLHVRREDARTGAERETTAQLAAFTLAGGEGWLPLAEGNTWTYTWAGVPAEVASAEVYRIARREGDWWHMEYYRYFLLA